MASRKARRDNVDSGKSDRSSVDQGWAWVVMLACCLWNFIIAGTLKVFGVIYVELLELYDKSPTETALVGFAFSFMAMILSPAFGYISDHHPIQSWTLVCGAISGLAMALTGLVPNLECTVWTYGVLAGTMAGVMDSPFLGLFNKYFDKKRSVANGVAFAGSSLGGLILPLMLRWSIDQYTIRGAMFFMGAVWMHSCVVAAIMCPLPAQDRFVLTVNVCAEDSKRERFFSDEEKSRSEEEEEGEEEPSSASGVNGVWNERELMCGSHVSIKPDGGISQVPEPDRTASGLLPSRRQGSNHPLRHVQDAKTRTGNATRQTSATALWFAPVRSVILDYAGFLSNAELLRFTIALFLAGFAYFNQLVFWPAYAEEIGMTKMDAALVISVSGITELVGRPILGYLGSRLNKTMLCLVSSLVACVLGLVAYMLPYRNVMLGYAAVFGLIGGSISALGIPILSEAVGPERIGSAAGLFPLALGLGSAIGPPFLGYLKEVTGLYVNSLRVATLLYIPAIVLLAWNLLSCAPKSSKRSSDVQETNTQDA